MLYNSNMKIDKIKKEFNKKLFSYITAGFGLVAGLAWNEAIKSLIEYIFPLNKDTMLAKFTYAILITTALVVITLYLSKLFLEPEETKEKSGIKK